MHYSRLPGAYTGFGGSGGGFFNAAARWRMYSKWARLERCMAVAVD
jgi:hypothetical protein